LGWSAQADDGTGLRLAVRNREILAVGYAGALRCEELATARVEDLSMVGESYRLVMPRTKTSRDGSVQAVVLDTTSDNLDPTRALDR
jgi:hypothetical protein